MSSKMNCLTSVNIIGNEICNSHNFVPPNTFKMTLLQITKQPSNVIVNVLKDYGPLISPAVAVGLFILTQYFTKRKERKSKEKTQTEKLNYLASLIRGIISNIEINITNFEDRIVKFKSVPHMFHPLMWQQSYELERVVTKLALEDYYLAYVKKFGSIKSARETFKRIIECSDTLYKLSDEIFNLTKTAFHNDNDRRIYASNISNKVDAEIFKLINSSVYIDNASVDCKQSINSLLNSIDSIAQTKNLDTYKDKFITPLYTKVTELKNVMLTENKTDELVPFLNLLRQCGVSIDLVYLGITEHVAELESVLPSLKKTFITLKKNSLALID